MAHGFNATTSLDPPLDHAEVESLVSRYAVYEESRLLMKMTNTTEDVERLLTNTLYLRTLNHTFEAITAAGVPKNN